jgi:hypothetical protein
MIRCAGCSRVFLALFSPACPGCGKPWKIPGFKPGFAAYAVIALTIVALIAVNWFISHQPVPTFEEAMREAQNSSVREGL